jgi:hypothetical protein
MSKSRPTTSSESGGSPVDPGLDVSNPPVELTVSDLNSPWDSVRGMAVSLHRSVLSSRASCACCCCCCVL